MVALACLWLSLRNVAWRDFSTALLEADYRLVGAAMVVQLLAIAGTALRWKVLFEPNPNITTRDFMSAAFVGELANSLLPARGGSLLRTYVISQRGAVRWAYALGTLFAEKLADVAMLLLLCVLLLPFALLPDWVWPTVLLAVALVAAIAAVLAAASATRGRWISAVTHLQARLPETVQWELSTRLSAALDAVDVVFSSRTAARLWLWSLGIWGLGAIVNLLVLQAVGLPGNSLIAVTLLVILRLGTSVPSIPAGIGLFEYLCVLTLSVFGIVGARALSLGVLLHFVVLLPPIVVGAVVLWRENLNLAVPVGGSALARVEPLPPARRARPRAADEGI